MRRPGRPRKTDKPLCPSMLARICHYCGKTYHKRRNVPWGRWLKSRACCIEHYRHLRRIQG